jgi:hypothetical protein
MNQSCVQEAFELCVGIRSIRINSELRKSEGLFLYKNNGLVLGYSIHVTYQSRGTLQSTEPAG